MKIASPIFKGSASSVTPGATSLIRTPRRPVQQLDPMYVDVTQSSSELLALRKQLAAGRLKAADLPAEIVLEDGTRHAHKGRLAFSETTVDPATGSYTLRIVVPNPDQVLLPGIYPRRRGSGTAKRHPRAAAHHPDPKGNAFAMVLDAESQVQMRGEGEQHRRRPVARRGRARRGERVIVEGCRRVRPHARQGRRTCARRAPAAAPGTAAKK
jgi:membrane fusion protein (multidrug efflux system)